MPQRLKYLYTRYINDQCTPEEMFELRTFLEDPSYQLSFQQLLDETWKVTDADELTDLSEKNTQNIYQNIIGQKQNKSPNYGWIKIAAAVLLFVCAGLLYQVLTPPLKKQNSVSKINLPVVSPIKAGGNNAILTLANGTKIILNKTPDGRLVVENGLKISKTKEGVVVYQFSPSGKINSENNWNTISTPRGGQYRVVLSDGSKVWLNASSTLRFPVAFEGNERQVTLNGEAYFEVKKNPLKPFRVAARGTNVQVLGTHFNVNAYDDDATVTTTLLEGSVRLKKGDQMALLIPGQQGVIKNNENTISVRKADITEVIGWKNGFFVFHDESIINIMKQISRWYDVDVEYVGDVQDREFGGTVSRYRDITKLLDNMQLTQSIHYKLVGRKVLIMK